MRLLEAADFSAHARGAAEVVFRELVGNVFRHAPGTIDVAVDWSGTRPVLHVLDRGPGFVHKSELPADAYRDSGRGLYIAATLSEELHISHRFGGGSHARAVLAGAGGSRLVTLPAINTILGL
jgi:anti-sigma regulatory factor (Ser/Thr protein kinase)